MSARYLSVAELAKESGISEYTIRCWLRQKFNPLPHLRVGRVFKVSEEDFHEYVDQQKVR